MMQLFYRHYRRSDLYGTNLNKTAKHIKESQMDQKKVSRFRIFS